jgi:hypothetical protein
MDELIRELDQLTRRFIASFPTLSPEEIDDFLQQRETIIAKMVSIELTPAQRQQYYASIQQLLKYDGVILSKFEQMRDKAREGIQKVSIARTQRNGYEAHYSLDSVFVDKRK